MAVPGPKAALRLMATIVAGFTAGALAALTVLPGGVERLLGPPEPVATGTALVGGPFDLIDHTGRPVSDADLRGRAMLILFGFTACPDDCPAALQVMAAALDALGAKADRVAPLFITLDPERDGPEQLAPYVAAFHPRLIGLTGEPRATRTAAKAYRVGAERVADPAAPGGYTYNHTSVIYLMDATGAYIRHFDQGTTPAELTAALRKVL